MCCERVKRARPLLGTLVEISLAGNSESELHSAAAAAFSGIAQIHDLMSLQSMDSDVFRLNNAPVGATVKINPHTWRVIELAGEVSRLSDGKFDIAVGGAMLARADALRLRNKVPDARATFRDIEVLDGSRVRFRRALAIDVGGIAKGYAVDHAVRILRDLGVPAGCVNAGGDLRVFGGESVPVQVRDPGNPAVVRANIDLLDRALATSANYADGAFTAAGAVLDPGDGKTVTPGRSASVRAKSCAVADALTKCVLLLGASSAPALRHYEADGFLLDGETSLVIDIDACSGGIGDTKQSGRLARPALSAERGLKGERLPGPDLQTGSAVA